MIDPRISLGVQAPNAGQAINIFENALMNSQTRDLRAQQEQRAQELAPFQLQQAQQGVDANTQTLNQNRDTQRLQNLHITGQRLKPLIESGDTAGAQKLLLDNISNIQARIEAGEDLDINESMETLAKLQSGDVQGVLGDINAVAGLVDRSTVKSVNQREFDDNVATVKADPKLETVEGKAASVALGLTAKASTSAAERIAVDPVLTDAVAQSEATIEGAKESAKEGAKLVKQLKFKPQIAKEVKLAEKAAIERGEVLTDLGRMEASLPGVREAVGQLIELSNVATSTLGGRAFDFLVKESGFGATKGADARAKLIAIVDNQVLPLLKETFGAAFTVQEGENLKSSLVDPNASPSQKKEQLEAFLAQKERNIRTKQTQLNNAVAQEQEVAPAVDLGNLSLEELIAERQKLGGQ